MSRKLFGMPNVQRKGQSESFKTREYIIVNLIILKSSLVQKWSLDFLEYNYLKTLSSLMGKVGKLLMIAN